MFAKQVVKSVAAGSGLSDQMLVVEVLQTAPRLAWISFVQGRSGVGIDVGAWLHAKATEQPLLGKTQVPVGQVKRGGNGHALGRDEAEPVVGRRQFVREALCVPGWVMGKLARQPITAAAATSARAQTAAATAATGSKAAMTGGTATAAATAGTAAMAAAAAEAGKLGRRKALAAVSGAQRLADGFGVGGDSPAPQRPANGHRPVASQVGSPPPAPPERER